MEEKLANMAETKQKWLKTDKHGRKTGKIWRKRVMPAIFRFCTFKLSHSFLPKCQFPFCQTNYFCSAKLNIFARGGQGPPPPQERLCRQGGAPKKHEAAILVVTIKEGAIKQQCARRTALKKSNLLQQQQLPDI